jgi:hypothetical protein
VLHQGSAPRSDAIACPICGRLLKWMPDRWLSEFECEECGPFSDFAGAALVSERRHRSPPVSLPHESARTKSQADEQDQADENDSGGTAA